MAADKMATKITRSLLTPRSEAGGAAYPAIRREDLGGGTSDEERGSGEFYSGEEEEDDIMFTRDRFTP